jgi:hypothetical protein
MPDDKMAAKVAEGSSNRSVMAAAGIAVAAAAVATLSDHQQQQQQQQQQGCRVGEQPASNIPVQALVTVQLVQFCGCVL